MEKKLPVYDMEINEDEDFGVFAISIVDEPAINSKFIALKESDKKPLRLAVADKSKQLLVGAVMIPDREIYRWDKETDEEYYVRFSEEMVERSMERFMQQKRNSDITLMHQGKVQDVTVVQTWKVEDPEKDKSSLYGLDAPKGSWVVAMKVHDKDDYEAILEADLNGFSLEGNFLPKISRKPVTNPAEDIQFNAIAKAAKRLLSMSEGNMNRER